MAISPRLTTARLGAASCPRGGPAPPFGTGIAKYPETGISEPQSETRRRRDNAFRARRRIFLIHAHPCSNHRLTAPADAQPEAWRAR